MLPMSNPYDPQNPQNPQSQPSANPYEPAEREPVRAAVAAQYPPAGQRVPARRTASTRPLASSTRRPTSSTRRASPPRTDSRPPRTASSPTAPRPGAPAGHDDPGARHRRHLRRRSAPRSPGTWATSAPKEITASGSELQQRVADQDRPHARQGASRSSTIVVIVLYIIIFIVISVVAGVAERELSRTIARLGDEAAGLDRSPPSAAPGPARCAEIGSASCRGRRPWSLDALADTRARDHHGVAR